LAWALRISARPRPNVKRGQQARHHLDQQEAEDQPEREP